MHATKEPTLAEARRMFREAHEDFRRAHAWERECTEVFGRLYEAIWESHLRHDPRATHPETAQAFRAAHPELIAAQSRYQRTIEVERVALHRLNLVYQLCEALTTRELLGELGLLDLRHAAQSDQEIEARTPAALAGLPAELHDLARTVHYATERNRRIPIARA
jgi:hypothetical protein